MSDYPVPLEQQPIAPKPNETEHDLLQLTDMVQLGQLLWRCKWPLVLGTLLGVALGAAYYFQAEPVYRSTAHVLVTKKSPQTFSGMDPRVAYLQADDMSTHVTVIESPWFAQGVVDRLDVTSLATFPRDEEPLGVILGQLLVLREGEFSATSPSSILRFDFLGPVPDECEQILNGVVEHYEEFLRQTSRDVNDDALKLITRKVEALRGEIAGKQEEYRAFREQAPAAWLSTAGALVSQDRLATIESQQAALAIRRVEIEPQLAKLEVEPRTVADRAARWTLLPDSAKRDLQPIMEEQLFPLLLEERALLEDFEGGHPRVRAVRDQIEFTRRFFTPMSTTRAEILADADIPEMVSLADPIDAQIARLRQELTDMRTVEAALARQLTVEQERLRQMEAYGFQDQQFQNDIAVSQQFCDSLIKQVQGVDLSKDLVGYSMKVIAPATGAVQVAPRALLVFVIGTFFGMLGGLAVGCFIEASGRSLRSIDEIRRRLGVPVVGHIPRFGPIAKPSEDASTPAVAMDPILCTYFRPNSVEAEAYRGVRAALYFNSHAPPSKLIQITSPGVGDGKTSLAANLAVSIAQSGRSVLLIDADLRRPRMHQIFGLYAKTGLVSVIAGEADPDEAIHSTVVAGLSILPCGPLPPNPADLLASPRIHELFDLLRERYDFVLIDTPPLLAVTDPRVVAAQVDGVLLAIRMTKNGRHGAERAKEILTELEAPLLGAVVNATNRHAEFDKYGYEHEQFGYTVEPKTGLAVREVPA